MRTSTFPLPKFHKTEGICSSLKTMVQLPSIPKRIRILQLLKSLPFSCQGHCTPGCRYTERSRTSSPLSSVLGIIFKEQATVQIHSRRITQQQDFLSSSAPEAELNQESWGARQPPTPSPALLLTLHSPSSAFTKSLLPWHVAPLSLPPRSPIRFCSWIKLSKHIPELRGSPYSPFHTLNKRRERHEALHALVSHFLSAVFKLQTHNTSCAPCLCLVLPQVNKGLTLRTHFWIGEVLTVPLQQRLLLWKPITQPHQLTFKYLLWNNRVSKHNNCCLISPEPSFAREKKKKSWGRGIVLQ